jgi:zinc and cadmium transporter
MNLIAILIGTLIAGVGSVWIAATLSFGVLARYTQHMLSLAAGALLATAFIRLLPEGLRAGWRCTCCRPRCWPACCFFLLDKAELWHHGHEHHPSLPTLDEAMVDADVMHAHPHEHAHAGAHRHDHVHHAGHGHAAPRAGGGWAVLTGDAVHCFGDGVLIASAFLSSRTLGRHAGGAGARGAAPHGRPGGAAPGPPRDWRAALLKVSLAGAVTALGGLAGWALVEGLAGLLPYPDAGGQQLHLRGAGRPDPAAAKAPERAADGGADPVAAGGHGAGDRRRPGGAGHVH